MAFRLGRWRRVLVQAHQPTDQCLAARTSRRRHSRPAVGQGKGDEGRR